MTNDELRLLAQDILDGVDELGLRGPLPDTADLARGCIDLLAEIERVQDALFIGIKAKCDAENQARLVTWVWERALVESLPSGMRELVMETVYQNAERAQIAKAAFKEQGAEREDSSDPRFPAEERTDARHPDDPRHGQAQAINKGNKT